MSEKILIRNADAIVTCDDADRVLYHSDILLDRKSTRLNSSHAT